MKTTFLIPPVVKGEAPAERSSGCTHVVYATPNIYELTLAACLEEAGHEVNYRDCINHPVTIEELLSEQQQHPADVYLMWTVNLSVENDTEICRLLHEVLPESWVLFVGPGASYFSKKCLVDNHTIVVHGEPEQTVLEWLDCMAKGQSWNHVAGISYLQAGEVVRNGMRPLMQNLDHLPIPARHLVKDTIFRNAKLKVVPYTTMVTSRNCPFRCIYCVPSSLTFAREIEYRHYHGKKPPIAFRSEEKVAEEIRQLHAEGYRAIGFMDDNFIWNEKRMASIAAVLEETGMVWGCQARVDAITEPIAALLQKSHCGYVDLGVESFDDRVLEYIHKGITSAQIYNAIHILQKYHVPVKLNLLIGTSPLETKESIRHTMREARRLHVDSLMINIVSPFPGTEFYQIAKENNWLLNDVYLPTDVQKESILSYPHLSNVEMEDLLYWGNLKYFLSPRFVIKQMLRFRSFADFQHAVKTLMVKLRRK